MIAALAVALAAIQPVRAAAANRIDHVRGNILGTTLTSLDVGTADRDDIHLDMAPEPFVAIAEPSDFGAIRPNDFVSVVIEGSAAAPHAHCVIIVPDTAHVFESGKHPWDLPGRKTSIVGGRVASIDGSGSKRWITVAYRSAKMRIAVGDRVPVVALRPGSRSDLIDPHAAFVFGKPPTERLNDFVQSVIVADGTLALPF